MEAAANEKTQNLTSERNALPDTVNQGETQTRTPTDVRSVRIVLGRCWISAEQVSGLDAGSLVELGAAADDDVELFTDGRLIARGKLLSVDGRISLRVLEIPGRAV